MNRPEKWRVQLGLISATGAVLSTSAYLGAVWSWLAGGTVAAGLFMATLFVTLGADDRRRGMRFVAKCAVVAALGTSTFWLTVEAFSSLKSRTLAGCAIGFVEVTIAVGLAVGIAIAASMPFDSNLAERTGNDLDET